MTLDEIAALSSDILLHLSSQTFESTERLSLRNSNTIPYFTITFLLLLYCRKSRYRLRS